MATHSMDVFFDPAFSREIRITRDGDTIATMALVDMQDGIQESLDGAEVIMPSISVVIDGNIDIKTYDTVILSGQAFVAGEVIRMDDGLLQSVELSLP